MDSEEVRAELCMVDENIILFDDLDEAVIGYCINAEGLPVAAYDYNACIDLLQLQYQISYEDAIEHMEYNVLGSYCGPQTPIFIYTFD